MTPLRCCLMVLLSPVAVVMAVYLYVVKRIGRGGSTGRVAVRVSRINGRL